MTMTTKPINRWLMEVKHLNAFVAITGILLSIAALSVVSSPLLSGDIKLTLDPVMVADITYLWGLPVITFIFFTRLMLSMSPDLNIPEQTVGSFFMRTIMLLIFSVLIKEYLDDAITIFTNSPGLFIPILISSYLFSTIVATRNEMEYTRMDGYAISGVLYDEIGSEESYDLEQIRDTKRAIETSLDGNELLEQRVKRLLSISPKKGFTFDDKIARTLLDINAGGTCARNELTVNCTGANGEIKATIYKKNGDQYIEVATGFAKTRSLAIISAYLQRQIVLISSHGLSRSAKESS